MKLHRWAACLLLAALVGCGDGGDEGGDGNTGDSGGDGNANGGGAGGGNGGQMSAKKPLACDVVSAEAVGEIVGVPLMSEPQDNTSVSICSYGSDSDEVFINLSLRIEYSGASYLDKTVEALEELGGSSQQVSGIGDAAAYHFYTQEFGGFSSSVGSFLVTKGAALISVTVADADLTSQRGLELGEEIARLSLAGLE